MVHKSSKNDKWGRLERGESGGKSVKLNGCMYWDLFLNTRRRSCLINVLFRRLSGCHSVGTIGWDPLWKWIHHQCPIEWIWQGNPTIPTKKKKTRKIIKRERESYHGSYFLATLCLGTPFYYSWLVTICPHYQSLFLLQKFISLKVNMILLPALRRGLSAMSTYIVIDLLLLLLFFSHKLFKYC